MKRLLLIFTLLALFASAAQGAITTTAGAWAAGSTTCAPAIPATPAAGDLMIAYVGTKPYNTTIGTPAGWTAIANTNITNGTVANNTDVGSVHIASFYRYWQSGDAAPSISITTGNVALCVIHRYRPTGGYTLDTPVGTNGIDTSSGTGYSATMAADPGITTGDMMSHFTTIAGNNATFATPTITATGATIGTVTENPATEGTTATGLDLESSAATATCTAGTSSAAPVGGWTLSVAQTGASNFIRTRETAGAPGPEGAGGMMGWW